ncbi:sentrin-specific protease 6-like isoform X3 [Epargyreus clarus]|uniref:sentrin-specific protease 6-like isoform X3 n=1 Tax=Epargyreus clarus TaxID=520877 RepID=UPI003C2FC2C5
MSLQDQSSSSESDEPDDEIKQLLIYPPVMGGIPITIDDYKCLAKNQVLSGAVIDFYLKYLYYEVLNKEQRKKTFILTSSLYKNLARQSRKINKKMYSSYDWDTSIRAVEIRYLRTRKWMQYVNIFEKDFVIIPINEDNHWFMIVICYPRLIEAAASLQLHRAFTEIWKSMLSSSSSSSSPEPSEGSTVGNREPVSFEMDQPRKRCNASLCRSRKRPRNYAHNRVFDRRVRRKEREKVARVINSGPPLIPLKPSEQPVILVFDSKAGVPRKNVLKNVRLFLTGEYLTNTKMHKRLVFDKYNFRSHTPQVPQQSRDSDSGLYALQYMEHFFKDPIQNYNTPINLSKWFDETTVMRKRLEIATIIKEMLRRYNWDPTIELPVLQFPTIHEPGVAREAEFEWLTTEDQPCVSGTGGLGMHCYTVDDQAGVSGTGGSGMKWIEMEPQPSVSGVSDKEKNFIEIEVPASSAYVMDEGMIPIKIEPIENSDANSEEKLKDKEVAQIMRRSYVMDENVIIIDEEEDNSHGELDKGMIPIKIEPIENSDANSEEKLMDEEVAQIMRRSYEMDEKDIKIEQEDELADEEIVYENMTVLKIERVENSDSDDEQTIPNDE